MAAHSNTLAWKIPWTEEPSGLQSKGSQGVGHNWATKHKALSSQISTHFLYKCCPLSCSLTPLSNTDPLSLSSTDGPLNRLFPMSECSFPPSFAWFSPHPATDSKTSSLSIFSRSPPFSQPPSHWWSFFVTQDCASPVYNCHWACLILCFLSKLAKINWIIMCQPISIYLQFSNTLIFITPTWSRWNN